MFFLRVEAKAWRASVPQFLALLIVGLVLSIAIERTFYQAAVFDWTALTEYFSDVPLYLLVGWLAVSFSTQRFKLLVIPVALYAAAILSQVLLAGVFHVGMRYPEFGGRWLLIAAYYGWSLWLLSIGVALLRRTARLRYHQAATAMLPMVIFLAVSFFLPPTHFWRALPPPAAEAAQARREVRESPASEEMLYLQPQLSQQVINQVARHRRGVADIYFIGYAPYAHEDVFMKESEVIRDMMDERFDTRGRSLLLVNNAQTLRKHPLATVTNLRAALQRIGRRINPEEDIVVLYLTSHGSKEHRLSARYWPLKLEEIDPVLLKELLDEAGIKWRVIAVSACYAGGFVEPLRSPTTLIMTAADATHTSFGCGNESDFTYFAKAVFDEQLRETYSFEQAFERALPIIREREQGKQEEFSNPQIAVGDAIRVKLAAVEQRLQRRAAR